jgi:hypothetical protein
MVEACDILLGSHFTVSPVPGRVRDIALFLNVIRINRSQMACLSCLLPWKRADGVGLRS